MLVCFTVKSLATGCQCIYCYFLRAPEEILQELSRRMGHVCVGFRYGAVVHTRTLRNLPYYAMPSELSPVNILGASLRINGKYASSQLPDILPKILRDFYNALEFR